ncbi:MAG TPA: metalloregulator ArsR/SmtB family transcription factor [Dehalococcoidia bacterium]
MNHPPLKRQAYAQFARIGQALASERRLELLDLLAQAPRHVEALAQETGLSVASVSQHLQVLRHAKLVEASRQGTKAVYRLADHGETLRLWLALCAVAESRLPELEQIRRRFTVEGAAPGELSREELQRRVERGDVLLIDVRPSVEYRAGHLPGAVSLPLEELPARLGELPRDRQIVAYCRGRYCLMADEAVALLRRHGFDAVRVEGGWPEWHAEGRPVEP